MRAIAPKLLLVGAAVIFGGGSALHAAAFFSKNAAAIGAADLSPILRADLKALWLADSTTLMSMALVCVLLAVRPNSASPWLTLLLALIPISTALLVYVFLGPFYAGHLLIVGAALLVAAGLLSKRPV
jgi:hypothetical protein